MQNQRIILQPIGNRNSRIHYEDTIANEVPLIKIKPFLTGEFNDLSKDYENGKCMIWGVTEGKNFVNRNKWEKILRGDLTLFYRSKKIIGCATVTKTLRDQKLAEELWGVDENGNTWEYIYFLSHYKNLDINIKHFNSCVGYNENYVIQGFGILDNQKSSKIFDRFIKPSNKILPEFTKNELTETKNEYLKNVNKLMSLEKTDHEILSYRRKEQQALRKLLFKNKFNDYCALCNNLYPIKFLVTAHIKKRTKCSEEERKDINVVTPMCKFGCDEVFEKGLIYVQNGILYSRDNQTNITVKNYIKKIVGNNVKYYNNANKKYFDYHKKLFDRNN